MTTTGGSFWIGKSREELSREAKQRAHDNSNTRIGANYRPPILEE